MALERWTMVVEVSELAVEYVLGASVVVLVLDGDGVGSVEVGCAEVVEGAEVLGEVEVVEVESEAVDVGTAVVVLAVGSAVVVAVPLVGWRVGSTTVRTPVI